MSERLKMSETPDPRLAKPSILSRLARRDAILVGILVVILLVASLGLPRFASPITVGYLLLNAVPILLIALPMTLIIITGEIDLSVASIVGMTTATIGALTLQGWDFVPTILVSVAVGVVAGAVNGALVAFVGLPSLAVTIGTLALYRGLALVLIGDNSVSSSQHPAAFAEFVRMKLGATGIPVVILIVVVLALVFAAVLQFSPFGRGLYALGYSKQAATFVGVKVGWSKFWLYVASGFVCGLVGVFWSLNYSARSDSATGLELTVIAAVLLGGISIFGGTGTIVGAIAGVLVISSINYALRLQRVPDVVLIIITGSLLIVSVVGPSVFAALRQRIYSRRAAQSSPGSVPGSSGP